LEVVGSEVDLREFICGDVYSGSLDRCGSQIAPGDLPSDGARSRHLRQDFVSYPMIAHRLV